MGSEGASDTMTGDTEDLVLIVPREGFLEVRFLGSFSVPRFKSQLDLTYRACRERDASLLFIDYTPLLPVPGTVERYEISSYGAKVLGPLTRVACLGTPDQHRERFGSVVARNRGLNVDTFTDRDEALKWLLEP
jgi:hypothetical protein